MDSGNEMTFQVTSPNLQGMDDCKAFPFCSSVIQLSRKVSAVECYRALVLKQDSTNAFITCSCKTAGGTVTDSSTTREACMI